jgi:hypothetical protein
MTDFHVRILRAAAVSRARQRDADRAEPDEPATEAQERHGRLERLAERARTQLLAAERRRKPAEHRPEGPQA